MQKLFIKNRKNRDISLLIKRADNPRGLAFVLHGSGGVKENDPMKTFARVFSDNDYNVLSFDATNTFGESYGDFNDLTFSSFYEDLEDVIEWSKQENFYLKPFIISGYSLGGMCSLHFAQNYPKLVKALALISTVFDGELFIKKYSEEELLDWKKTGTKTWISKHGYEKKLKYSYIESLKKADVFSGVNKMKIPIILLCGDLDETTPLDSQKLLFETISSDKEMHIIKGAGHSFHNSEYSSEIYNNLNKWIKKIN